MPTDEPLLRSRRAILAGAAAGAAALAAHQLASPLPAAAIDVNDLALNIDNPTTLVTSITQGTLGADAFNATGAGVGRGIVGSSPDGAGVIGVTTGVVMAGVIGLAGNTAGSAYALANADLDTGLYGFANATSNSSGVWGESGEAGYSGVVGTGSSTDTSDSTGVYGFGDTGVYGYGSNGVWGDGFYGVRGLAVDATGSAGVLAQAPTTRAYALYASGKVKLTRSGRTYVSARTSSRKVVLAGVTSATHVLAQLATNRAGYYIQAVVPTTGSFTIYLNKAAPGTTYVHYVVFDA